MERKRANKKRGGRVEQLYIIRGSCLLLNGSFTYGAVRPDSPAPALLHVGTFTENSIVQELPSSAPHMASLGVKCSLIWPLVKLL